MLVCGTCCVGDAVGLASDAVSVASVIAAEVVIVVVATAAAADAVKRAEFCFGDELAVC